MLETPRIRRYSSKLSSYVSPIDTFLEKSAVTIRSARTISRKGRRNTAESSEAICRTRIPGFVKIWSDLHGDMQSQAEQKRPGPRSSKKIGGNKCVGPYPPRA